MKRLVVILVASLLVLFVIVATRGSIMVDQKRDRSSVLGLRKGEIVIPVDAGGAFDIVLVHKDDVAFQREKGESRPFFVIESVDDKVIVVATSDRYMLFKRPYSRTIAVSAIRSVVDMTSSDDGGE